jgi:sugar phosphate isomerase/epimerase
MGITRRQFFAAASAAPAAAQSLTAPPGSPKPRTLPPLCLHSQIVVKIEYPDLGPILRGFGFDGCDLTVRDGGHVAPTMASMDLVRAAESIRGAGVDVPVISTALTSAQDPGAREVLAVGGIVKIPLFRPGQWKYGDRDIMTRLTEVRRDMAGLASLGRAAGMAMAIHNYTGGSVGGAVWDTDTIIRSMDPQSAGFDFDAASATAEGGAGAWEIALRLALPRLKMVTARDFYWSKTNGRWAMTPCPLGEGMVDWPRFFGIMGRAGFQGPISMQIDYQPGNEVAAIQKDLAFLKKQVAAAYPAA